MAKFIIRVELHNANYQDYETLHDSMYKEGFSKTIQDELTKEWFNLPTAEYYYENALIDDYNIIIDKVKIAANKTNKIFGIVVTKAIVVRWEGLDKVKN
ncbi:hypothetical protein GCM10023210_39820 [Chryseobacterium ginsengisoli]|uniref:Uncharacterized protein n=1 Tax=Chryseobacterium ginsengisoli TaxID=363853 RepID=A0ABP9MUU5_9FLAO